MAIEVDNLFQALDIILDQRLQEISYDKTEVCTIVDATNAKNGKYWVSPNNGETRYEAYSESNEYKHGESVRVSILNGDFTQKKFITGKYVVDDAITPMTYVSPLNTVIDVTGNMISDAKFQHQFGLVTNGNKKEIPIWSADLALDESYRDLQASGIYNTIALSAQFRTLLDNYDIRSGSYGLRLDIYTKVNPESDKYIVRSVSLDSSEMFGNPYSFVIYGTQAKKFDLSQIGTVEKMVLWFYQSGDFSYYDIASRETITINIPENLYKDNILMRNVKVSFGSDLSVIEDNTIQAYTSNSKDYHLIVTEADNEKRLGFLWYNKDANNQYLGFSDGIVEFETDDDGEIVYTNKLNKNWENATEDVVDDNGKVILMFVRNENNQIVLIPDRDSSGNVVTIANIDDAKTRLNIEIQTLENALNQEYQNGIIGDVEYNGRNADIRDYKIAKLNYLNTPHSDPEAETAALARKETSEKEANDLFNQNQITDLQLRDLLRAAQRQYETEIQAIQSYRIEMIYILRGQQQEVYIPKVKHYDEIDYLNESEADSRLMAQNGRENIASDYKSLKIAADFAEAKPLINKTIDLVTKDLYGVLRQMQQRTQSVAEISDLLKTLLMTPVLDDEGLATPNDTQNINAWFDTVDQLRTNMNNVYAQFLAYNYRNQEWHKKLPAERDPVTGITYLTTEEQLKKWIENPTNLWEGIKNTFNDKLIPMLEQFFENTNNIIKAPVAGENRVNYSGYQGIYDTYYNNAKKVAILIQNNLDKLELLLNGDATAEPPIISNFTIMKQMPPYIGNTYAYIDYTKKDFTASDNKYAIYWYRYEPGYKSDDRLISAEWKRLTTKTDFGIDNTQDVLSKELALHEIAQQKEAGEISEAAYIEKEKAIIDNFNLSQQVYNFGLPIYDNFELRDGKYYFSSKSIDTNTMAKRMMDGMREQEKYKIILFYNHEMFESNEIVFTNLDDVPDATTVDKSDAIVIKHGENSQDTYQSYGLTNYLVNAADASKIRTISVHYEGLLAGDEALAGTQVYWYIPNQSTMLTCDDAHLTETLGFYSDRAIEDGQKPDYSKEGYTCYYKPIRSTTIKTEDDPTTDDINEASETVTANQEDLTFTYKIKDYYLATASRNDIICKIVKDEYTFETEMIFAFTSLGTSGTDYTLAITPSTTQIAVYPDEGAKLSLNIRLYDYNNKELPISTSMMAENGATDFKLDWEGPYSYNALPVEGTEGISGAEVTLRTVPGENDSLIYGVMKVSAVCPIQYTTATDESGKDAFGDAAEDKETGTKQSTRNVNLTSYYPVPYSAGNYYIEGATTIVYDSMGSNPSYYKDPYKIFTCNSNQNVAEIKKDNSEENKYDIRWRMVYYKKGVDGKVIKLSKDTHKDYNMCRNYMPTLNEKNGINPTSMYMDNMDCWCAVECWQKDLTVKKKDQKYSLLWVQPILIIQNRYASPMLNAWDGSLTIDKKNGTILSSMVGAGRKTRNNTFEGVLMGDVEGSAGIYDAKNKSGLGLYGFNDGAQSFGFNVDGTGFIGKSGRGRISFNGNEGTIESASYTSGEHPYGMKIDFDDGWIDMKGGVEFEEEDWINYIIDKYKEVLNAQNKIYNELTGLLEPHPSQAYVIDTDVMTQEMQEALQAKIIADSEEPQIMYAEAISALANAINDINQEMHENGATEELQKELELLQREYSLMEAKAELVDAHYVYYALTTVKTAELLGEFEYNGKTYEFTKEQYNVLLNELDAAVLMETYSGTAIGAEENYRARYGPLSRALEEEIVVNEDTGATRLAQSNIHLDVKAPYFYVVSEQGNRLINIGTNEEFKIRQYNPNTSEPKPFNGKGYYLKTNNYLPSTLKWNNELQEIDGVPGKGMLIDLAGNKIDAYEFTLKGEDPSGSYLKFSSDPTEFVDIYSWDPSGLGIDSYSGYKGNHVLLINEDNYQLRSFDWYVSDNTKQGMLIDLGQGLIKAHSNATDNHNKEMVFSASADGYNNPISIGTIGSHNFKVAWDGALSINGDAFKVDKNGNVTISQGSINIGNGAFKVDTDGSMTATKADIQGTITATNGKIGGWSISGNDLTCNNVTLNGTTGAISGSAISGGSLSITENFGVTSEGVLTANGATITGTITAEGGKIAGWTIDGDALYSGLLYLTGGETSTIAATGTNASFSLSGIDGKITATKAEFTEAICDTTLRIKGDFTCDQGDGDYAGNKIRLKSDDIWVGLTASTSTVWIDGTTTIGSWNPANLDSGYRLGIKGSTIFDGQLAVKINGTAYQAYAYGKSQTFKVGTWSPVYLKFSNGILISATDSSGNAVASDDANDNALPDITGHSGHFLKVNSTASGLEWASISLTNSTFKIGSGGTATSITPTVSGDTATFTITVPGGPAGSAGTVYLHKHDETGEYKLSTSSSLKDYTKVDQLSAGSQGTSAAKTVYLTTTIST